MIRPSRTSPLTLRREQHAQDCGEFLSRILYIYLCLYTRSWIFIRGAAVAGLNDRALARSATARRHGAPVADAPFSV